jgi:hypothetical protein
MLIITSNTFGRVEHKNSNPIILGLQMFPRGLPSKYYLGLKAPYPNVGLAKHKSVSFKGCSQADAPGGDNYGLPRHKTCACLVWLVTKTIGSLKYQASVVEMKNLEKKHFSNL